MKRESGTKPEQCPLLYIPKKPRRLRHWFTGKAFGGGMSQNTCLIE